MEQTVSGAYMLREALIRLRQRAYAINIPAGEINQACWALEWAISTAGEVPDGEWRRRLMNDLPAGNGKILMDQFCQISREMRGEFSTGNDSQINERKVNHLNEIKVFENETFGRVRTVLKDNEPWFVAADVCRALEVGETHVALRRLDEDEKDRFLTPTLGGQQEMSIVNEPGLYSLVLGSRKPEAKAFKRWITHEVIPSIRKHDAYMTPAKLEEVLLSPDTLIQLAHNLKAEQEKSRRLKEQIDEEAPKVLFADSVACSNNEILVGELAKILKQNGVEIGQNRLFERLRNDGYLVRRKGNDYNMPTQRSMEMGLMRIKETSFAHPDGHTSVNRTPKITGKGQIYFVNHYGSREQQQRV